MTGKYVISGTAFRAADESSLPDERPDIRRAFAVARRVPRGKGVSVHLELTQEQAREIAWHLESIADLWDCLTAEERGSDRSAPLRIAIDRLLPEVLR